MGIVLNGYGPGPYILTDANYHTALAMQLGVTVLEDVACRKMPARGLMAGASPDVTYARLAVHTLLQIPESPVRKPLRK